MTSCLPLHEWPFESFRLILAHASAAITCLAFLHDPLPDPIVREALECFRVCARQIWVQQWCLSIERRIERDEQNSDQADIRECFHATFRRGSTTK